VDNTTPLFTAMSDPQAFDHPDSPASPPLLSPSALPATGEVQEISLVEEEETTGVTFTPESASFHVGQIAR
jgi:hypothetical protein